jgi:hypothetical protein
LITGLGFEQFQQIRRVGSTEFLDVTNFCPDLELAIARAMVLVESIPASTRV